MLELSANDHLLVNQILLKINTNSIIHFLCFELEVSNDFYLFKSMQNQSELNALKFDFSQKSFTNASQKQCFTGLAF